ncbi:MAG: nitroreductase family protein [Deltaproteobacteria bacterium]|nr:nitroreductase family protein [Deltaproteobacteria bacterium]
MERKIQRREFLKASAATGTILLAGNAVLSFPDIAMAAEPQSIQLSKPQPQTNGNPALLLLQKRASSRELSPRPLPAEILSELLWAAFGINRADGRRTAPTASNRQDMDIYVILAQGCYLYDAKANRLNPVAAEDLRGLAGTQPFARDAPVNLIYVCDYSRMSNVPEETKILFSGTHTGAIAENVYLYCTARGLATVVRASIDRAALAKAMKLRPEQKITLGQPVGYPKM